MSLAARPVKAEAGNRAGADAVRTPQDQQVWRTMVDRIKSIVSDSPWHHRVYREAFAQIVAWRDAIPDPDQLNAWLAPTGWRCAIVDGYVPVSAYQKLQSERIFPISWSVRKPRDIDHAPSPDFVHDVLGHLPMLFDEQYAALVQEWAERGLDADASPADRAAARAFGELLAAYERPVVDADEIASRTDWLLATQAAAVAGRSRHFLFESFYTWAIEMGFVRSADQSLTLIGAAALSSPGEMTRLLGGSVAMEPFADGAVGRAVNYTRYQDVVFVVDDFDDYVRALRRI
jgi:phenylalanine-4-hydroxylase